VEGKKFEEMSPKELYEWIMKYHVIDTMGAYSSLIKLGKGLSEKFTKREGLTNPESWRPFMPPLFNYIVTCLEVYFENKFLKTYVTISGTRYENIDDWFENLENFRKEIAWISKEDEKLFRGKFSFQRLYSVQRLYLNTFNVDISSYSKYDTIQIMFQKRHMFTHKGGIIDRKFWSIYNTAHTYSPQHKLPEEAIGKLSFLEYDWVVDSIEESNQFVEWIDQKMDERNKNGNGNRRATAV
jgi:hypothetical protein